MNFKTDICRAIAQFWETRNNQIASQLKRGQRDQGARGAVTGGKQMLGFELLAKKIAIKAGIPEDCIFCSSKLELPGFFRPEKKWDFLIVWDKELVCAVEFKSQVGPSFGNNFNNRTEEAIGTASDLWIAFREGALQLSSRPFLGYFFLLEEEKASTTPVRLKEPHFNAFPWFKNSSYSQRYHIFLRNMLQERQYDSVGFALSKRESRSYAQTEKSLDPVNFFIDLDAFLKTFVKKKAGSDANNRRG